MFHYMFYDTIASINCRQGIVIISVFKDYIPCYLNEVTVAQIMFYYSCIGSHIRINEQDEQLIKITSIDICCSHHNLIHILSIATEVIVCI